jgi:hypothetical protein
VDEGARWSGLGDDGVGDSEEDGSTEGGAVCGDGSVKDGAEDGKDGVVDCGWWWN